MQDQPEDRICVKCKWREPIKGSAVRIHRCRRPLFDRVVGFLTEKLDTLCLTERYSGECGDAGKFFKAK